MPGLIDDALKHLTLTAAEEARIGASEESGELRTE
jgi:hypothetical protein